ncbi:UNKNOWN [Stylonychia lemnae]|uniref:Uncharacterized protein n=1 Tax=Stylonychia lemnae TaxID=5949 RepID=A0A077ZNT9_STYLE|nr:UNKNOWN [Stylonychia lemnae]|eukprot:CDW71583.1 UNKNOWN [Stylonychia lemnae]
MFTNIFRRAKQTKCQPTQYYISGLSGMKSVNRNKLQEIPRMQNSLNTSKQNTFKSLNGFKQIIKNRIKQLVIIQTQIQNTGDSSTNTMIKAQINLLTRNITLQEMEYHSQKQRNVGQQC